MTTTRNTATTTSSWTRASSVATACALALALVSVFTVANNSPEKARSAPVTGAKTGFYRAPDPHEAIFYVVDSPLLAARLELLQGDQTPSSNRSIRAFVIDSPEEEARVNALLDTIWPELTDAGTNMQLVDLRGR